jgi:hypothetical protein
MTDEFDVADPALAAAVLEIEAHVAAAGWDRNSRLYALVDTARIVASEPEVAAAMGLDASSEQGSLTAVEQDSLPEGTEFENLLAGIIWPADVVGCAAVVERLVLPPEADAHIPEDPDQAVEFAATHPLRQEVRIVAGATRAGATYCALRMRAHDDDQSVVGGADLVPELLELLRATLHDEHDEGDHR